MIKMTKKLIAIFLVFCLAFIIIGCKKQGAEGIKPSEKETAAGGEVSSSEITNIETDISEVGDIDSEMQDLGLSELDSLDQDLSNI